MLRIVKASEASCEEYGCHCQVLGSPRRLMHFHSGPSVMGHNSPPKGPKGERWALGDSPCSVGRRKALAASGSSFRIYSAEAGCHEGMPRERQGHYFTWHLQGEGIKVCRFTGNCAQWNVQLRHAGVGAERHLRIPQCRLWAKTGLKGGRCPSSSGSEHLGPQRKAPKL